RTCRRCRACGAARSPGPAPVSARDRASSGTSKGPRPKRTQPASWTASCGKGDDRRMRSIWKGSISFGLVSIPVKLYSATEERDVSFHQVHRDDGGRIRYKRVCQLDGEEIPYSDIAKGYELPSGEVVVLTDDDFADLPLTTSRSIDVLE